MREIDTVCRTPPGQAAVSLRGASGELHGFTAFPLNEAPSGPAVYIFARPVTGVNRQVEACWTLLRIRETGDKRDRDDADCVRHAQILEGHALGATHILVHFCHRDADRRRRIFSDLGGRPEHRHELETVSPQAA